MGSTVAVTERRWQDVLAVACGIFSAEDLDQFAPVVLEEIDRLVPAKISWFNGAEPLAGRARVVRRPYIDRVPFLEAWRRWSHQDPVLTYMMNTGDGSARRLSDFLTGEELHLLELYTFVYGPLGVEFQVVVGLPAPGPSVVGIALNRADNDFTDEELKLLDALRPHLGRAYRTAQLLTERRQALESIADALEEEGRALHVVGTPLSGGAAALVEAYFGQAPAGELPSALAVWVELKRQASVSGWTRSLAQPLVSSRDGRSLTVRFVPGGSGPALLLFVEHYPERDAVALERLGLSPREAEVLWRIARGASVAEIAQDLRISVGRVDGLLKRVYVKLGVSTRGAAIALAYDALMLGTPGGGP